MNDISEVCVSIICNTYNHEKYIKDALESFVTQKTNFAYEILVHDDASTDNTANIIREYEAKYPNLIKPIYQTENQYSNNVQITTVFQHSRVRGKYIAYCEGDDFWIDDMKLQKQVEALEAHPEVDICAHQAQKMRKGEVVGIVGPSQKNCIFTPEQVIAGGGGFVATASLMYRSTMIEQYDRVMNLDYVWQIYGSLRGGMLYLADTMSVYRLAVGGSWTECMQKDVEKRKDHSKRIESMLQQLNVDTDGKYSAVIHKKIILNHVSNLLNDGQYRQVLAKENRVGYKCLPWKLRVKIRVVAICPWTIKVWKKIKKSY